MFVAMRLTQMEQVLERSMRQAVEVVRQRQCVLTLVMPVFSLRSARGWKERAWAFVDALRVAILKDPDLHTVWRWRARVIGADGMLEGVANEDWYIAAVTAFLEPTGFYQPITGQVSWRDRRRASGELNLSAEKRSEIII